MTQPPDPGQPDQPDDDTKPLPPAEEAPPGSESPHGDPLTDHGSAGFQQPPPYQQGYQQSYQQPYQQGYQQPYPHPGYQQPAYYNPAAPYGIHVPTGLPYSDKSKLIAGLLQVLLPLGIGRMYMGFTGLGVAQLCVTVLTCGIGALWPFIDGILILVSDSKDSQGRILKS